MPDCLQSHSKKFSRMLLGWVAMLCQNLFLKVELDVFEVLNLLVTKLCHSIRDRGGGYLRKYLRMIQEGGSKITQNWIM